MKDLTPDATCPNCRRRPVWRIAPAERERYLMDPPEQKVGSYQCHQCGSKYDLTAGAYQRAA